MIEISSKSNPKIKELIKLQNNQKRKKSPYFIVEGAREVHLALKHGMKSEHFFVCSEIIDNANLKEIQNTESTTYDVEKSLYNSIAYRENTEGVIGVFFKPTSPLKKPQGKLVLILDNIEKPGNLGAIYRSANAFGIKEIIHTGSKNIDIYHPNSIRASLGGIFSLSLASLPNEEALDYCKTHKLEVCLTSAKNSTSIKEFEKPKNIALIMGSEEKGASDFWAANSDHNLLIPMQGGVSSLNVSVAAGICMFSLT